MLTTLAAGALAALTLAQQGDTTVNVPRGTRLEVDNFAGAVTIRTWDRDAVRVLSGHGGDESVSVELEEGVLSVSAEREMGMPDDVRLEISAPRTMPVEVSGVRADVTIEGMGGEVFVETVEGRVRVRGGSGIIALSSVQGPVELEGARGRIELSSVNESVRAVGVAGEISAETVNGAVTLERADVESVEATTVNGTIAFAGAIKDGGVYRFATHNGNVTVAVPQGADASVSISTFQGEFESDFGVQSVGGRHGRDLTFVLGSGGARIEMESFQGLMRLVQAGPGMTLPAGTDAAGRQPDHVPRPPRPPRAPRVPATPATPVVPVPPTPQSP